MGVETGFEDPSPNAKMRNDEILNIVATTCNVFTLLLSTYLVYNLVDAYLSAKKNRDKKKRTLYFYSIMFVSLNFMQVFISLKIRLSIFTQINLRYPGMTNEVDLAMELYTLFCIFFFFRQWKESLLLYIDQQLIQPMKDEKSRKSVAFEFVMRSRKETQVAMRNRQAEAKEAFDHEQEDEVKSVSKDLYSYLIYKTKKVQWCCCRDSFTTTFSNRDVGKALKFDSLIQTLIYIVFGIEVLITAVDLMVTSQETAQTQSVLLDQTLDALQVVLAAIVMYLLGVYKGFMKKVVKRDDPFSNSNILAFVVFCVVIQKYIIEYIFHALIGNLVQGNELVIIRQTIVSIELLFIAIPFRHNFSLDHIEI